MRQPWLAEATGGGRPAPATDDFHRGSAVRPLRRAALILGLGYLLLAMGRSGEMLDAAYGLPLLPGTETLILLAETWHGWMERLGLPGTVAALRDALAAGR